MMTERNFFHCRGDGNSQQMHRFKKVGEKNYICVPVSESMFVSNCLLLQVIEKYFFISFQFDI